jgi:DNA end-binding protein Ku
MTKERASAPAANVINLMDGLRRSIAGKPTPAPKKQRKRVEGQREMLLPITGRKEEGKKAAVRGGGSKQQKAG